MLSLRLTPFAEDVRQSKLIFMHNVSILMLSLRLTLFSEDVRQSKLIFMHNVSILKRSFKLRNLYHGNNRRGEWSGCVVEEKGSFLPSWKSNPCCRDRNDVTNLSWLLRGDM
jgi:predicted glutamine amidotransferase